MEPLKEKFKDDIIKIYNLYSYSLGAGYVKQLLNYNRGQTISTDKDKETINSLNEKYNDQFWTLIDSFINMQRTENRYGYQVVAGEKEKVASEFASTICWTSFNQGIKNKGLEYKDQIQKLGDEQIAGIIREVRNKDLTIKKQLILTQRLNLNQEDREKLSAARRRGKEALSLPVKKGPPAKLGRPVKIKDIPGLERNLEGIEDFAKIVFVLITQRDEKVCAICRDLELDTWESGDPDLPDPPVHENCRCRLALAESEFLDEG